MTRIKDFFTLDYYRFRKIKRLLSCVNAYKDSFEQMTDEELQAKTPEFKQRLADGESLDDLLPEAFALVREVDKRILGKFPYDVQVMGAIVLHQGNLAEMKTGEGKTLTATMPLYLNALEGKGAMLITTNAYLARRDAEEVTPVFHFLGLTISAGVADKADEKMEVDEKKRIYNSDIVYTTNSSLGFDYLIDNLAPTLNKKYMREFHYAIVDEADAVLLDMAQTPLIISGAPRLQSNLYDITNTFILTLAKDEDYYFDKERKEVWLTQRGIDQAERFFAISHLYENERFELVRHINLALKGHLLYENGKDYLVEDGKVQLLDQANGRLLESTKLQGGQHQALEAKEGVEITPEMRAMASITYQNLFTLFKKLSGMTGTGKPAEDEFIDTYNMEVVSIPTNLPVQRQDYPDRIFTTLPEKVTAIVQLIREIHETGQPILLVTGSVRTSELFSEILLLEGIPHSLLNAFNEAKEAQMIAEAGRKNAVTVATNMAGRGTDIKLTQEVRDLGGLAVIGTERMANERMDLQMRGRSGRQGDPGFSQFFVCLEDDLITKYGGKPIEKYFKKYKDRVDYDHPKELRRRRFKRMVARSQAASESSGKSSRARTMEFDQSVKIQRNYVYDERNALLNGSSEGFSIEKLINEAVDHFIEEHPNLTTFEVERFILDSITYESNGLPDALQVSDSTAVKNYLLNLITDELERKRAILNHDFDTFQQIAILRAIDEMWVEEVDFLQQLRIVVSGRQSAQRNPIFEYHREALTSYEKMKADISDLSLKYLMLSEVNYSDKGLLSIQFI
ncbi:TPA: accessory Sec system translocase SecA2 [Streptococcus suis]|nr:accessory Sec system translocase SecA2 [Streptococcus suis]BCP58274.1 protein translocase subunit SecA 2 [Streptococcus parasuis]HEM3625299.1 accessory Sec system translocase SecA2 [Streptococcus suis]